MIGQKPDELLSHGTGGAEDGDGRLHRETGAEARRSDASRT
jgi:hypothetical protein